MKKIEDVAKIIKISTPHCKEFLQSLSKQKNLEFKKNPTIYHSFSVFNNNSSNESFRLALPINYPRISQETSFDEYANNIPENLNPYILLLLGKGKGIIGYFENDNNTPRLKTHREVNRTTFRNNKIMFKVTKHQVSHIRKPLLAKFYSQFGHAIRKWAEANNIKFENGNNMNIGYIANSKEWETFWEYNKQQDQNAIFSNPNYHTNIPFTNEFSNLIKIGGGDNYTSSFFSFPNKRDLIKCAYEFNNLFCITSKPLLSLPPIINDYVSNYPQSYFDVSLPEEQHNNNNNNNNLTTN